MAVVRTVLARCMAVAVAMTMAVAVVALGALAPPGAWAADKYPARPVKVVVSIGPGSATDTFARLLAEQLRQDLKATFVVDNKAGAGGTIGGTAVARAPADGYTIGVLNSSVLTTSTAITPNLPYTPGKDFTWLAGTMTNPLVLAVRADSPFKTLEDFVAAAKAKPGTITAGLVGEGSHSHFNLELLALASGTELSMVPYSVGTTQVLNALLGGEIDSASTVLAAVSQSVRGGRMRLLAATSPLKDFPDVPTFASRGYPGVDLEVGFFVVGPAAMPADTVDALVPAIERAMKNPQLLETMENLGTRAAYETPKQLAEHVSKEIAVVTPLARKLNLRTDK